MSSSKAGINHSLTHSSLEVFDEVSVLDPILWSNNEEVLSKSVSTDSHIDFTFRSDYNNFIDLQEIYLKLSVVFKKPDKNPEVKEEPEDGKDLNVVSVTHVNNLMHSLFSDVTLELNGTQVYTSNGLYAHKAFVSNEYSHNSSFKTSVLGCQGYILDDYPELLDTPQNQTRQAIIKTGTRQIFFGKLCLDAFTCDKLLIPGVNVRIRLTKSDADFVVIDAMQIDDNFRQVLSSYYPVISDVKLLVRKVAVDNSAISHIENAMSKGITAKYCYPEIIPKTFVMPMGVNQFKQEDVFERASIRRLLLALNTNSAFRGKRDGNPFWFQKFDLRQVKIIRGSQTLVDLDTRDDCEAFVTTLKALKFNDDGPGFKKEDYENRYVLAFDLTSTQEANVTMYFPEVLAAPLRVELYFDRSQPEALEIFLLGERLTTVSINDQRSVSKNLDG